MSSVTICFIIFLFVILGYIFYEQTGIPMGVTAMAALLLLVLTGCIDTQTALSGFSGANTIMMISMFIVAAGFGRTQMVHKVTSLINKLGGGSFRKTLTGFIIITCILSQFIPSPLISFTVIYPMVVAMCNEMGVSPSKAIFPVGFTAISTCGVFPVGAGAIEFARANGILESFGSTYRFEMLDFFKARLPVLMLILIYSIFIAPRLAPDKPPVPLGEAKSQGARGQQAPLSRVREVIGYATFSIVTLCLMISSILPLENWQIAMMGALIMVGTGVLTPKEMQNALPVRIICMYIGALALGSGLAATGAGDIIGRLLSNALNNTTNSYVIGLLFFLVPFCVTQVMQNQSVAGIFYPIAIMGCQALNCNPMGPIILVQAASLTAYMTPMATGTVPLMMGAGGYDIKSLLKQGWIPAILICAVSVFWTMTLFPAYS